MCTSYVRTMQLECQLPYTEPRNDCCILIIWRKCVRTTTCSVSVLVMTSTCTSWRLRARHPCVRSLRSHSDSKSCTPVSQSIIIVGHLQGRVLTRYDGFVRIKDPFLQYDHIAAMWWLLVKQGLRITIEEEHGATDCSIYIGITIRRSMRNSEWSSLPPMEHILLTLLFVQDITIPSSLRLRCWHNALMPGFWISDFQLRNSTMLLGCLSVDMRQGNN